MSTSAQQRSLSLFYSAEIHAKLSQSNYFSRPLFFLPDNITVVGVSLRSLLFSLLSESNLRPPFHLPMPWEEEEEEEEGAYECDARALGLRGKKRGRCDAQTGVNALGG